MPALEFTATLLLSLTVILVAGYPLSLLVSRRIGAERLLWSLPIGLAVLVVAIRSIQWLVPVAASTPFILAVLIGASVWVATGERRRRLGRDSVLLWRRTGLLLPGAILISVVLINFPVITGHAIVFEGPGHDGIFYVANAIWMQTHSYLQPLDYSVTRPAEYLNQMFFGLRAPLGRVGAEGYLSFLSSIIGRSPLYPFHVVEATAFLVVALTTLLLIGIKRISRISALARFYVLCIVFVGPLAISIPLNSNFATLFGIIFSTAFALSGGKTPALTLGGRALIWAGLLATYPELAPFALACRGLAALFIGRGGGATALWASIRSASTQIGVDVIVGSLAVPWILYSSLFVIDTAYFVATGVHGAFPDVYAGVNRLSLPLAYLTTSTHFTDSLSGAVAGVYVLALAITLIIALFGRTMNTLVRAGLLLFVLGTVSVATLGFNYGLIKIPQYFSCYISAALCAPVFVRRNYLKGLVRKCAIVLALMLLAVQLSASYFVFKDAYWLATQKYIDESFMKFVAATHQIANKSLVAISINRDPFYYSMWFGLLLHNPVRYINSANGGFYAAYLSTKSPIPLSDARYLITDQSSVVDPVYPSGKPVLELGKYQLYSFNGVIMSAEGLYSPEAGFSWLSDKMQINITGFGARYLNVHFGNIFKPIGKESTVTISQGPAQGSGSCSVPLGDSETLFSVALPALNDMKILVKPNFPARSPSSLMLSDDPRPLTVQVKGVSLTEHPLYTLVQCQL